MRWEIRDLSPIALEKWWNRLTFICVRIPIGELRGLWRWNVKMHLREKDTNVAVRGDHLPWVSNATDCWRLLPGLRYFDHVYGTLAGASELGSETTRQGTPYAIRLGCLIEFPRTIRTNHHALNYEARPKSGSDRIQKASFNLSQDERAKLNIPLICVLNTPQPKFSRRGTNVLLAHKNTNFMLLYITGDEVCLHLEKAVPNETELRIISYCHGARPISLRAGAWRGRGYFGFS